jgi:hypothetical protein
MSRRREKELRCFCARTPLLATYGVDGKGKLFVHVKIYKARRIFGELVVEGGVVKIRCRDCLRWHTIRVYGTQAVLQETREELPAMIVD